MSFNKYAKFYDFFYQKKNYSSEINKVKKLLKINRNDQILEIGCGTGMHTKELYKINKNLHAIDKSRGMVNIARQKFKNLNKKKKLKFSHSNILDLKSKKKYDKIVMLFHVFSYFYEDKFLKKVFKKLHYIINKNGLVIFDYWNADFLNAQSISNSYKKITTKNLQIERKGEIKKKSKKKYLINYNFTITSNQKKKMFKEIHKMRAFSKEDIKFFSKNYFRIVKTGSFDKEENNNYFSKYSILQKI